MSGLGLRLSGSSVVSDSLDGAEELELWTRSGS